MPTHASTALATIILVAASSVQAHDTARDAAERTHGLFKPGVSIAREHAQTDISSGRPPLYEGLGTMTMAVSTGDPGAQRYFDQALALAWAFNHAEARRSFREGQRIDPTCAMCFWGEAYVLGANLNDAMHPDAMAPAHDAIRAAMALRDGATAKEQALIEALSLRYGADPAAQPEREAAWAEAMVRVSDAWPDDVNLLTLKAEALMNLQAWDYWEANGVTPKGRAADIVATLERALAIEPDHPAAIHFYIHAVEASATPERAEPYADRLRGATPGLGHLVHMPAHIYMRVGRHADLMAVNRDAIDADERMLAQAGDAASPIYRYGYYPHNVHFLLVGAQNSGLAGDALEAAAKLDGILSEDVMRRLAWTQAIKTAPYSAHALFSDAETVLALDPPSPGLPLVTGFWRHARAAALARAGDLAAAADEVAALDALIAEGAFEPIEAQFVPARAILGVALHSAQARIHQAAGRLEAAERSLRDAIAIQDGIPYMEPPFWPYPVRQSLGAVLLQQGRDAEAVEAFTQALVESPRSGWVLWGLAQAQTRMGAADAAATTRAAFEKVWLGDRTTLTLARL